MKFPKDRSREWKCVSREIIWFFGETTYVEQRNDNTGTLKLAVTNRNRKLPLNEAWKHYWFAMFPGGLNWQEDLEAEVRRRLYFPGIVSGFLHGKRTNFSPPEWASELEVSIQGSNVLGTFQGIAIGTAPLFLDSQHKVLSNWETKNPLEQRGALTQRISDDRRDILTAAVRDCGITIRKRLVALLNETDHPKFEVYCKPNGDVFDEEKKLPIDGIATITGIDVTDNRLTSGAGGPVYHYIRIKHVTFPKSKAGPKGTFRDRDLELVELMRRMIDEKQARSVRQAAIKLSPDAPRRNAPSQDEDPNGNSVVRRLQKRFSETHPNYMNLRGQTRLLDSKKPS